MNLQTPLGRLRLIGLIEGISCILLFFVAMPLKYLPAKMTPEPHALIDLGKNAVSVVGSVHGALWVLFILAVVHVWRRRQWPEERVALAVLASIPPTGTFFLDRSLRREQRIMEQV